MRASRAEIKIQQILTAAGVHFEEQYSFRDLISANGFPLRFDFAVFDDDGDLDFLIEYQGIQHFKSKEIFGGLSGLRKQQKYDMQKRQYCQKHKIKLLLIPYWDENLINYNYIFSSVGY